MTAHLETDHQHEVQNELRGMVGAQCRAANMSMSGPRCLDEQHLAAVLGELRPLMSERALAATSSAMKKLLCMVTAYTGRSDLVSLNPMAEFSSFMESAMA